MRMKKKGQKILYKYKIIRDKIYKKLKTRISGNGGPETWYPIWTNWEL
jgi:hypothetical protein